MELYQLETKNLEDAEFNGKLLYVSQDNEQGQECKYQTVAQSKNSIYLLKLFSNRIKVIAFMHINGVYALHSEHDLTIKEGEWDSIYGSTVGPSENEEVAIIYGKTYNFEQEFSSSYSESHLQNVNNLKQSSLNENEHFVLFKL